MRQKITPLEKAEMRRAALNRKYVKRKNPHRKASLLFRLNGINETIKELKGE